MHLKFRIRGPWALCLSNPCVVLIMAELSNRDLLINSKAVCSRYHVPPSDWIIELRDYLA